MILGIIQARLGSTRLPGKVLADIAGKPMLQRVVERARRARLLDNVIVATSDSAKDDALAAFCCSQEIAVFRGSENDVLDRYWGAAKSQKADIVVRITSDCPLLDPNVVDRVIERFLQGGCDYVSNTLVRTFPDGLDVEAFSFAALDRAHREAVKVSEREHVTPYLWASGKFRAANVLNERGAAEADLRWTVDDARDLEFVRAVYGAFGASREFETAEILGLLRRRPELMKMTAGSVTNEGYYKTLYESAGAGSAPRRNIARSQEWMQRAERVIPGCAQTFSKGPTQYVQGVSPNFLVRGSGCRVWDADGNEYIDYVQGLLPNILGYAHAGVNEAVARQLAEGHSFSLPHPLEVELAERLCRLIPCAEMVRYGKNGSDATSGAVRAARAFTGRERIACCGYHGWQDWYIGSTARSAGVPEAVRGLTHSFPYNNLAALSELLESHSGEFAAVIMEPYNFVDPALGYLQGVKDLIHKHGGLLIFDEICTGFRFGLGGAQAKFGVTPDLACFGKSMGNGFPIACVVGRADVMQIFSEIFFSFTFAGDVSAMAAAMHVLEILENTDALVRMEAQGRRLQEGFNSLAARAGLAGRFTCFGSPVWSLLRLRNEAGQDSLLERSLFQQEMIKRGVLQLVTHNMTAAHDDFTTERTLECYAEVLKTLSGWLSDPHPENHLEGDMIQAVFKVR